MKEVQIVYNSDENTRLNKFEKRRKNTKVITILMTVGVLLLIILLASWLFGGKKDTDSSKPSTGTPEVKNNDEAPMENKDNQTNKGDNETKDDNNQANDDSESEDNSDDADDTSKNENVDIKEVDSSRDDDNIETTLTGNWQPIGTEQSEPHEETQFVEESVDWKEMKQAIALAAGLDADEMITWFVGNDGEQKVVGTVSPSDNSETYRVYISWITDEGWKPTQVEVLKDNEYDK